MDRNDIITIVQAGNLSRAFGLLKESSSAVSDPDLALMADGNNYNSMGMMFYQGIWDLATELTDSLERSKIVVNTFLDIIHKEKERIMCK